jgi:2-iminobutanoate/2-iminopropanoate deaminase
MTIIATVYTGKAPEPIGPYSQAVACGDMLYCSGQIALEPSTGTMDGDTVEQQTRRVMANIEAVLDAHGLGFINAVYDNALCGWKPARSVVEVSQLPKNALVEIETVACR